MEEVENRVFEVEMVTELQITIGGCGDRVTNNHWWMASYAPLHG